MCIVILSEDLMVIKIKILAVQSGNIWLVNNVVLIGHICVTFQSFHKLTAETGKVCGWDQLNVN